MSNVNESIQKQFGNVAENYKTSAVHASGEDLRRMVELFAHFTQPQVLDVGCGAGHVAVNVAPYSQQVIAYDLTPAMLEQVQVLANERGVSNVVTQVGNVEELPFEDQYFDVVASRYSAHHWQHPQRALQEIARVLKSNGQFMLSDIVASEHPAQDTFLQTLEYLRDTSHVRDHRISDWTAMLEKAGFQVTVAFEWHLPLQFDSWVKRMATPEAHVSILKRLYDNASLELRETFQIQPNYDFVIQGALFVAHKPL